MCACVFEFDCLLKVPFFRSATIQTVLLLLKNVGVFYAFKNVTMKVAYRQYAQHLQAARLLIHK